MSAKSARSAKTYFDTWHQGWNAGSCQKCQPPYRGWHLAPGTSLADVGRKSPSRDSKPTGHPARLHRSALADPRGLHSAGGIGSPRRRVLCQPLNLQEVTAGLVGLLVGVHGRLPASATARPEARGYLSTHSCRERIRTSSRSKFLRFGNGLGVFRRAV